MMRNKFNVSTDRTPENIISHAKALVDKHQAMGTESPLTGYNMEKLLEAFNKGTQLLEKQKELAIQAKKATLERNMVLGINQYSNDTDSLYHMLLAVGQILRGQYLGKERMIEEFGYNVTMSTNTSKEEDSDGDFDDFDNEAPSDEPNSDHSVL